MIPDYLQTAAISYRLDKARRLSLTSGTIRRDAIRVYGSWRAYEDAVSVLPHDQRENYERAGIVLQPKQLPVALSAREADILGTPSEIGTGGARGGGKSHVVFSQVAVDDCLRFPGLSVLYLRRTARAGEEQMRNLVRSVLRHVTCEPKATSISYPNGSRITIGGFKDANEALKYQGIEYDVLVIEELTQLPEYVYKTLRLSERSSKGWRPRVYTTFNPLGIGHQWVKRRFVDPQRNGYQGNTLFFPSTAEDNVFNNPEYIRNLEDLTGAELLAYRYGEWDIATGAYFDTWVHEQHVINPLDSIPEGWRVWLAMDAGYSHWNVTLFFAEDTDGNIYVFHELAHRKLHPQDIAPDILATARVYGLNTANLPPIVVGTDAFRLTAGQNETVAAQYRAHGLMMMPADMSPGSRITGWQAVGRALGDPRNDKRPGLFVTRNCNRLIECIPYAERDERNPEDIRKWDTDAEGNGGDDPIDALRYGLVAKDEVGVFAGAVTVAEYNTFKGAM